ncbi:hypothetical protein DFH09DRAFT_864838, partial [Mycena vulgaris]
KRLSALADEIESRSRERTAIETELVSIVYPILSLPTDVTSEIFARCVDHPERLSPAARAWIVSKPAETSREPMALVLSRICKTWRTVALATPRLWRVIPLAAEPGEN